jgi:RecB family endonuclease NucS
VRLVIAKCSVDYVGRLSAHLPLATRLLMVKADGSVSVHADDRAYKPLNWMSPLQATGGARRLAGRQQGG